MDDRLELLARLGRGHRLLFDSGRMDPGWRSALIGSGQVRGVRRWHPSVPEALLAEGLIRRREAESECRGITVYERAVLDAAMETER